MLKVIIIVIIAVSRYFSLKSESSSKHKVSMLH